MRYLSTFSTSEVEHSQAANIPQELENFIRTVLFNASIESINCRISQRCLHLACQYVSHSLFFIAAYHAGSMFFRYPQVFVEAVCSRRISALQLV